MERHGEETTSEQHTYNFETKVSVMPSGVLRMYAAEPLVTAAQAFCMLLKCDPSQTKHGYKDILPACTFLRSISCDTQKEVLKSIPHVFQSWIDSLITLH